LNLVDQQEGHRQNEHSQTLTVDAEDGLQLNGHPRTLHAQPEQHRNGRRAPEDQPEALLEVFDALECIGVFLNDVGHA